MKLLILIMIGIIIYCLGSAMYYMVSSNKHNPQKTAKALTWRIALSISVFCLLLVGFLMGWITPHGI